MTLAGLTLGTRHSDVQDPPQRGFEESDYGVAGLSYLADLEEAKANLDAMRNKGGEP